MTRENSCGATAHRETPGSHMAENIPRTTAHKLVNTVIRPLQGQSFEYATTVFATDAKRRLEGIARSGGSGALGSHSDERGLERVTGIEPASSAWEAEALPLDDTRLSPASIEYYSHSVRGFT